MASSPRVTRYLMRELLLPSILGLLLYTFVLMMNHFFLVAEKALSKNLGFDLTLRLFAVGVPKLLVMAIPMAILLGTLIGLGRLSADHEWVALQAAGQGPMSLLRPVALHGLMGAVASFMIYAVVVPQTHYAARSLSAEVIFSSNLAADLRPRLFYELPDDALLYVDEIRPGGDQRLENVLFVQPDPDSEGKTTLIVARYGDLYPAADGTGALIIDLFQGELHYFDTDPAEKYLFNTFDTLTGKRLEPPRFLQSILAPPSKVVQDYSMGELQDEIKEAVAQRRDLVERLGITSTGRLLIADRRIASAKIELHRRFSLPTACIFLAFLALPLGITTARSGKGAGFALSVVVIVVYRVVFVTSTNQALNGKIPAEIGPWIANAFIFVWAMIAFFRMRRASLRRSAGNVLALPFVAFRRWRERKRRLPLPALAIESHTGADELVALGGSPRRFIGRLDRYVAVAFLRKFMLALISTFLIYSVVEGQELIDRAVRTNMPLSLVARYLVYFAPGVLHVILPISCLVGAVVAVTLLSRTSELTAIKAAGVSMQRVTLPIVLLTLLLGGSLFVVQDRIAPATNRKAQEIEDRIAKRAPRTHGLRPGGSWRFGTGGTDLFHYRLHDPDKDVYQGLSVFTLDRSGSRPRISGHRFSEEARQRRGQWLLESGWYRSFGPSYADPSTAKAADFHAPLSLYDEPYEQALDLPSDLSEENRWIAPRSGDLPEQVSLSELGRTIEKLRNSGNDITRLQVAYYRRFAEAAAPLVMVLLGLPFAFRIGRRGSLYGIGVALLLVLVYWATFAVFNALGLETLLPPLLAAWAPNALFALLGIYLLLYVPT